MVYLVGASPAIVPPALTARPAGETAASKSRPAAWASVGPPAKQRPAQQSGSPDQPSLQDRRPLSDGQLTVAEADARGPPPFQVECVIVTDVPTTDVSAGRSSTRARKKGPTFLEFDFECATPRRCLQEGFLARVQKCRGQVALRSM